MRMRWQRGAPGTVKISARGKMSWRHCKYRESEREGERGRDTERDRETVRERKRE